MIRSLSLFLRRRSDAKNNISVLDTVEKWRSKIDSLPPANNLSGTLAIIRLDDIGDYLLFRNFLGQYKANGPFSNHKITLIGNIVWKPIYEKFDSHTTDEVIWVDKHQYFGNENYRLALYKQIRELNCYTVICPARTRPLLIDDMLAMATGAKQKIACENSFISPEWNTISNKIYDRLSPLDKKQHEFNFNRDFAAAITTEKIILKSPFLPLPENHTLKQKQILCFIGASAKSKIWPINYWVALIKMLQTNGFTPMLSGGKNEMPVAEKIIAETGVASIVGKTNLLETLDAIASSNAIITGDTMAAHAAVAYHKPTVILANGVNAKRFVAYKENLQIENVETLYTKPYLNFLKHTKDPFIYLDGVTSDMKTIKPDQVIKTLLSINN
jgi:ADP-heptose:LPS heptosyltransferase